MVDRVVTQMVLAVAPSCHQDYDDVNRHRSGLVFFPSFLHSTRWMISRKVSFPTSTKSCTDMNSKSVVR